MTENQIVVQRTIDASAKDLFEVLTNPEKHAQLDGSGFVRSVDQADRIQSVGQVFTMNMEGDHMGGEYQTDNHVTAYAENKMVGWQTAPAGTEPKGWEWLWELEPEGSDSTVVTLTYDWDKVTDEAILRKVSFPLVSESQLEESLNNLAAAVTG
ncbi:SRPBCC family protein [Marihabitans asiaticum]|uniref:Activator of Hsp90 ATPase-like protein n=1 Tax=Marihabitans asiaticum TaxID=415218 RepID=A0A560WE54_9MICO|nr:SRPBCC family protein [Marihabitans asiaticum]TWD15951.1 activator of Hsp90 ATPase-like protein [Marihabitans asiaticum]